MSTWHQIPDENIELDNKQNEINILLDEDKFVNNYVTLTFRQVLGLADKIKLATQPNNEAKAESNNS